MNQRNLFRDEECKLCEGCNGCKTCETCTCGRKPVKGEKRATAIRVQQGTHLPFPKVDEEIEAMPNLPRRGSRERPPADVRSA
jgi:cytochrome c5